MASETETSGIEYGLAVARDLLQKVANYWEGRPLTHHGDHIMADLLDVLRAITPADQRDAAATARLEAAEQLREAADDIRGARLGWTLDDIADALGQRAEQVEAGER